MCARYQAKPVEKHLNAVKQIFRYLKGTIDMGLWYSKDSCITLTAYADADTSGVKILDKAHLEVHNSWGINLLPNQEFDEPPSDEEIVSFIKELGYKGDIGSVIKKKLASPSKKQTLVITEEPAKKPTARIQLTSVQISDTLVVSVSKKKTLARAKKIKGIDLLFKAVILKETQMKKAIKRSKQETHMHQAGGSGDGVGFQLEGVSDDDDDINKGDDERIGFDIQKTNDEEERLEDEFVHTPEDYVPTDNETNDVNDEEYRKINDEMYDYVNVELKDAELDDEDKGDAKMADVVHVNVEKTQEQITGMHKEINPKIASAQVQDIAQETTTVAPGLVYNLLKGTCKSFVELEYKMEECNKALNDQLYWNNPEGDRYTFDLSKPLPLVESRNRLIVLAYYSFNNDLAYLQGGSAN
nr:uncharacterized mitochondrial protein AtMg00810-like [Tanacetum cinerariifolium]